MKNKLNYIIILLLSISSIFCSEISDIYYNLDNSNLLCSNKNEGCSFNVSYNYPISPKIPTSIPSDAILSNYRYVYLKFLIPKNQNQKTFYLEAYDTSNEETIISNGDCYFINTTENIDYEIRIYKTLKKNSYIRFGFLGISLNFTMTVKLRFSLSISLYFNDIALTYYNSLNISEIPSLEDYLVEKNKKIIELQKRGKSAKETCSKIMENVFNTPIDISLFEDSFINSIIIPIPPFIIATVSYALGLELATESHFQSESIILSETTVIEGEIHLHYDGLDFLNEKLNVNNNIIKRIDSYNKKVTEMINNFGLKNCYFTLTISTNNYIDYVIYTLKFYYGKIKKIDYEIQIKVKFMNSKLKELVTKIDESIATIDKKEINYLLEAISFVLKEYALVTLNPEKVDIVPLLPPLLDINKATTISLALPTIIHDIDDFACKYGIDTAKIGGTILDMKIENGIYHAVFDCWQSLFGYNILYDFIFDLGTSMEANNEGNFTFNNENYILWGWKGDYLNLGAGAELGIYYGASRKDLHWKVNKSLAMPMTLTLTHKTLGTIVNNWDNWGKDAWWITAFNPNPKFKKVKAEDLRASFTVKFKNGDMFEEFAKTERKGWSYDKKNKVGFLNF